MAQNETPAKVATSAGLGPGPEARPLVDRLRQEWPDTPHHRDALHREAADEIDRLTAAFRYSEAHAMRLMNERDAALNLWPRDCRLCANHTTASGGCTSTFRCVDSDKYKPTTPRQLWEAAPLSPAPF